MKKIGVIDGQIDLFNMPVEIEKPQLQEEKIIEKPNKEMDSFRNIINIYKNNCNRIVITASGALMVGLQDKTLYFNQEGKHEFDLNADVGLIPADKIILVNRDIEPNEIQLEKLKELNPLKYIKRKGEPNITILTESKTKVITSRGWILEWNMQPVFNEDEVFLFRETLIPPEEDHELKIGDIVEFVYENKVCTGEIVRIYNNGDTVNVSWEGKRTAFYHKSVKKIA